MNKILIREIPNSGGFEEYPWNGEIQKKFGLDHADISLIENGRVYFDADGIAYSLEEDDENQCQGCREESSKATIINGNLLFLCPKCHYIELGKYSPSERSGD